MDVHVMYVQHQTFHMSFMLPVVVSLYLFGLFVFLGRPRSCEQDVKKMQVDLKH